MIKNKWWTYTIDTVSSHFKTNIQKGLNTKQIIEKQKTFGYNKFPEKSDFSLINIFIRQWTNIVVWILIIAIIISILLGKWLDAVSICIIVLLNAIIGFFQEYSAEKTLEYLKKLVHTSVKVIRNNIATEIPSTELVPGDIVQIKAGDLVPADGRIIEQTTLSTQEASLTGESFDVFKETKPLYEEKLPTGNKTNMLFMGTTVVSGNGVMIVTEIGVMTELGAIATSLKKEPQPKTPLQIKFEQLGKKLTIVSLCIVIVVFFLGYIRNYDLTYLVLISLSLAVAAVPEGLLAIMSIALAIGAKKMAQKNVLIRRLSSVETLGSTSVICVDKTGTLTQNKMVVTSIWIPNVFINVQGAGYKPEGTFFIDNKSINPHNYPQLIHALKVGTLANNSQLVFDDNEWKIIGSPTEGALLTAAERAGIKIKLLKKEYNRVGEIPFDSERKMMSVIASISEKKILYSKGAPDVIIEKCNKVLLGKKIAPLTDKIKNTIINANKTLASQGLRILGLSYKELTRNSNFYDSTNETDLVFIALTGMIDPPRPEVKKAIKVCKQAGIKVVMVTGDYKDTGVAIAKDLGIYTPNSIALNGQELDQIDNEKLHKIIGDISVFARMSPKHKIRIIKAWKSQGKIIAMTGDGVNDAPAIKAADIGIAMGITGSDVAKQAADMVLLDDNFATIVNAIEQGRGIYENILKFVQYMVSSNLAELLVIFAGLAFGFKDRFGSPYISLLPLQILWINLVTDGLPALALAVDPISPRIMQKKPIEASSQLLSLSSLFYLSLVSTIIAIGVLFACHYGLSKNAQLGHTLAFTMIIVLEFVRIQMIRLEHFSYFWKNPLLITALIGSLGLQLLILYTPTLQNIFKVVPLTLFDWGVVTIIAILVFIISKIVHSTIGKAFLE